MKKTLAAALLLITMALAAGCAANGLSKAAVNGDLQTVQSLVGQGENVNAIDGWGWTPLHWAVYYGNFPVTQWLLDHGANPNAVTTLDYGNYLPGTTPLILAAAYGHDDAVAALLKKKADPSIVDRKGKKAIDYAQEYEFAKCVALLKKK